ncbi:hypothetical protein AL755_04625 [Arthrobacter sp. ERGS1:01]|uniref:DUF402 domain-containing protein n=1 Tax=Arthrobacter sp. ERGS1:01 TaxID=1704044 RepID=UPI0006CB7525|nr:DUF402 domain-containing protein [Arthrobacter sp. ERGS1:01]ALE07559.1 hypothetical protein AL755_04625 [Arthrobacter sp. ERGS1:01]
MTSSPEARWRRGDTITWTYLDPTFPDLLDLRPVTVVADDDRHLAVWLAPGTRMLHPVIADGRDIRSLEGTEMFTAPRAQAVRDWSGSGILVVFQPETMYSVWFFKSPSGLRDSYYVNIEAPFVRTEQGIESTDLVLDVVVKADHSFRYKDEDELAFAHQAGVLSSSTVVKIRQAGADAVETVSRWGFPFDAGFETFQPDRAWPVPALPDTATWDFEI